MKRVFAAAILLAVMLVPLAGAADIPDGLQCEQSGLGLFPIGLTREAGNYDRFAICVTDGTSANGAELYIGGELNPELVTSGEGFCGAVIIAGRTLQGTPDWDHVVPGKDPFNPADDVRLACD
ncbi:MAG: hypothetical protein ACRDKG_12820 [Actinomycetota bacterium]